MKRIFLADYGIHPGDGNDHAPAIRQAIRDAAACGGQVVFEAGKYYLKEMEDKAAMNLFDMERVTLTGAVHTDGSPATMIEVDRGLGNDLPIKHVVMIRNSSHIRLENFIFDFTYRPNSAARILSADPETDTVVVEVLEGVSHFEGMKCYSANAWDLETREMLHVLPLTIGLDKVKLSNTFHHVPGANERTYAIQNLGFSDRVKPGDGMSWNFNVVGKEGTCVVVTGEDVQDLQLENIQVNSSIGPVVVVNYSKDLSFKKITIKPQDNYLVVGSRDAFWHCGLRGTYTAEDVYIKGVRWDPFNLRSGFLKVEDISEDRKQITVEYKEFSRPNPALPGQKLVFWEGKKSTDGMILGCEEKEQEKQLILTLQDPVPEELKAGSYVTPGGWLLDQAVFRNVTIEGNCGTGILFQNHNLLVENCKFRNNTYDDICLGPIDAQEGVFVRNAVIRNNEFDNSTWVNKTAWPGVGALHDGAISVQSAFIPLMDRSYNENIVIENNVFKNEAIAICLRNSQNVIIGNNTYENVETTVKQP